MFDINLTGVGKGERPAGPQASRAKQPPILHPEDASPEAEVSASFHVSNGMTRTYLRFTVAQGGQVRVKVMDANNDEVIREIPPDEVAEAMDSLRAYQQLGLRRGLPPLA